MAWVTLSDATGSVEVPLFSEVLGRARDQLTAGRPLLVTADIRTEGDAVRITAQDLTPLDDAIRQSGGALRIWLRDTAAVPHISALLARPETGGRGTITIVPIAAGRAVEIALPGRYAVGPRLRAALKSIGGVERVDES